MNFRNAIKAIFGRLKTFVASAWREIGGHQARFIPFGTDIYANDVVRACIRALATHSSKANGRVIRRTPDGIKDGEKALQEMIRLRPNIYMNGKDFLYKVRTLLEIHNIVFIYIMRDEFGKCTGLYPMPNAQYEAVEVAGRLYIRFRFSSGVIVVQPWEDLAVLRKDYNESDVYSDSNKAILTSLDLLSTTHQGLENAIKSTSSLRGVLKTTKAMLKPEDTALMRKQFVEAYMTLDNSSGIGALDATTDFVPIELKPALANYKTVEDLRLNIYRYFGVNEDILLSKATPDQMDVFYEAQIEPFLIALHLELTYKVFTSREMGYGNEIIFEANRLAHMSTKDKLALVGMVDRGALTPNEWREILNLGPIEGGDKPIRRLDTVPVKGGAIDDNKG